MRRYQLAKAVESSGCTMEIDECGVGWEVLISAPCGSVFSGGGGRHELVTRYYSDRAEMYREAGRELAEVLPLVECPLDCEWCYAPEE